ncbi:MAG: peptidylprolyl isomerase [Pirellulales bacterium]|nr:peptidylprolyl isomerase [Pirellulales bacterium]
MAQQPRTVSPLPSTSRERIRRRTRRLGESLPARARRHAPEQLEERCVFAAPTLATISNVTLQAGAPLHIALDGFDADGDQLTYSAISDNGNLGLTIPTGNRSMKISVVHASSGQSGDVAINGDMIFQLFDDLAPNTAGRIAQLAQSGFYNGLTFHRIASPGNPFVIQGGDPSGNGTGGSGVNFDDEFNVLLQHTSKGILSMAKTSDDTNDSQFFITATATRHLDFNHSIFGFLTEGESIRAAIQGIPVGTNDVPLSPVFMQNVSVFVDHENGVLRLSAPEGTTGTANVTVTVSDGNGGTAQRTFQVTIVADTTNNRPFLHPTPAVVNIPRGGSTTFSVSATDVEGGQMIFGTLTGLSGFGIEALPATVTPDGQVGTTTFKITNTTAPAGTYTVRLAVRDGDQASNATTSDSQLLTINVVDFQMLTDNGASSSDLVTDRNNTPSRLMQFRVGTNANSTVVLKRGDDIIGSAVADANGVATVTTNGAVPLADGTHVITAYRDDGGTLTAIADPITITVDTTAPIFTSTPVLTAIAGLTYSYNAQTNEEGSLGLVYELQQRPAGMTIDPNTGQITWVPTVGQPNGAAVVVRARDQFGAITDQPFEVYVEVPPTIAAIANQSLNEGVPFSIIVTATDANTPPSQLTYSLVGTVPNGAAIDPTTGEFTWTPSESQGPGTYDITIRAKDDTGLAGDRTVRFTVGEVNTPPSLAALVDRVIEEGGTVSFTASASDADLPAQTLTYSLGPGAPDGATIDPSTGAFSFTAGELHGGQTFAIEVRVSDGNGGLDSKTFQIEVIETNSAPTINPIPTLLVSQGDLLSFTVVANDSDVPTQTISFSLGDDAPAGATIDPATGLVTWQTAEDEESRQVNFTVIVTDSEGLSSSLVVTVQVGNDAPLAWFPGGPFAAQLASTATLLSGAVLPPVLPLVSTVTAPGGGNDFVGEPPEFIAGAPNFRFGPDTGVQALLPPLDRHEVQRPQNEEGGQEKVNDNRANPANKQENNAHRSTGALPGATAEQHAPAAENEPSEDELYEAAVASLDLAQADVVLEVLLADRTESGGVSFALRSRPNAPQVDPLALAARDAQAGTAANPTGAANKSAAGEQPAVEAKPARPKKMSPSQVHATTAVLFPLLVTEVAHRDDRQRGTRDIGPWRWRKS